MFSSNNSKQLCNNNNYSKTQFNNRSNSHLWTEVLWKILIILKLKKNYNWNKFIRIKTIIFIKALMEKKKLLINKMIRWHFKIKKIRCNYLIIIRIIFLMIKNIKILTIKIAMIISKILYCNKIQNLTIILSMKMKKKIKITKI